VFHRRLLSQEVTYADNTRHYGFYIDGDIAKLPGGGRKGAAVLCELLPDQLAQAPNFDALSPPPPKKKNNNQSCGSGSGSTWILAGSGSRRAKMTYKEKSKEFFYGLKCWMFSF
jgi:hypothetical protein